MLIVADESIPLVHDLFSDIAEVKYLPGRKITKNDLSAADILIIRSITSVNSSLLKDTPVKFVGSCTAGFDHLCIDYLHRSKINWSHAPGCNAASVVEYVLSVLVVLSGNEGVDLKERTYGIIGHGNVGQRLRKIFQKLGWRTLISDPPLEYCTKSNIYSSLEKIIEECDVITFHPSYEEGGIFSTKYLLNAHLIEKIKPKTWIINTSRGEVIDTSALYKELCKKKEIKAVLDVWENEPEVNRDLLELCSIATPHIAGYSLDSKIRAIYRIYREVCIFLGYKVIKDSSSYLPRQRTSIKVSNSIKKTSQTTSLHMICNSVYDPKEDDLKFRRSILDPNNSLGDSFDFLRNTYRLRREINGLTIFSEEGYSEVFRSTANVLNVNLI